MPVLKIATYHATCDGCGDRVTLEIPDRRDVDDELKAWHHWSTRASGRCHCMACAFRVAQDPCPKCAGEAVQYRLAGGIQYAEPCDACGGRGFRRDADVPPAREAT